MSTPESAGWYDDPEDETQLRYFDGIIWSDRTVPRQSPGTQPTPAQDPLASRGRADPRAAKGPRTDVFGRPAGGDGQRTDQPDQQHPGYGPPPAVGQQYPPPNAGQAAGGWGGATSAGPTTRDGQPLARYGSRVGAYLIDALILMVINLVLVGWAWWLWIADYWRFVWEAALAQDAERIESLTPDQLLGMLDWRYLFIAMGLSLLVQAIYHVGFLATRNATPGKMALGLSVRGVDHPGPLGVGTAFMRMLLPLGVGVLSLLPLMSYLLWFVQVADLLWPLRDPRRQALHDKIAGTVVIKGKQPRRDAHFGG